MEYGRVTSAVSDGGWVADGHCSNVLDAKARWERVRLDDLDVRLSGGMQRGSWRGRLDGSCHHCCAAEWDDEPSRVV